MKRAYAQWGSFLVAAGLVASYGAWRIYSNASGGATSRNRLVFELALEPGEKIAGAAAGNLADISGDALVLGTWTIEGNGHVHILHQKGNRYERVWTSTGGYGNFAGASILSPAGGQPVLITQWTNGNHAFLDVVVFRWDGRTYQEIWRLEPFTENGQLTQEANLTVQRFDESGDIQLMIRTPISKPGEHAFGPVPHQVSLYRWDTQVETFVLFKRFVDPQRRWE